MNIKRSIKKHRKLAGGLSLMLGVAAIFMIVCSPLAVRASATTRKLPVYCVQRDDKCVSLTFDAAWGNVILRHEFCGLRGARTDFGTGFLLL